MPQISTQEFKRLPLRVHDFLAGVPLHDAWAIDLPGWRTGVRLDASFRAASNRLFEPSPLVRMLLGIRLFVGRLFGWDQEPAATAWEAFAMHLTDTDHSTSLAAAGTRDGFFRVVYRFENEQLVELIDLRRDPNLRSANSCDDRWARRAKYAKVALTIGGFNRKRPASRAFSGSTGRISPAALATSWRAAARSKYTAR